MQTVNVKKDELLGKMIANRTAHVEEFNDAMAGFREEVVLQLSDRLAEAESGMNFSTYFSVTEPSSFESEYDTIIGMLEMCVEDRVELDANQYKQWVKDEWAWTGGFKNSTALYAAGR